MDELEFRKRVYANPAQPDQELLDAASENPAFQKILDDVSGFEADFASAMHAVQIPDDLSSKLLAIPANDSMAEANREASKPSSNSFFQYYAIAASLLVALGIGAIISLENAPSATEVVFGNDVIRHLYHEMNEIDAINAGSYPAVVAMPAVVEVMALADTQFNDDEFLQSTPVRFAKPCEVLPTYHSAHLMLEGSQGAVNIIVINNSPVSTEYSIKDDRFNGIVIPMGDGNLILIGEKDENLDRYKSMFAQNVEWVI